MNIAEIEMALATIAEQEFDKAGFPFQFIECFKVPKATVTKLKGTLNKASVQGELLWPKKLYYKPCKEGDVEQALDGMMDEGLTKTHKPQYLLVTDGVKFSAYDRSREIYQHGDFSGLNESFDFFLSLAGIERYEAVEEALADIRAAGRLAKFYDAVLADNPDWNDEGHVHTINLFLTRILFCMFAEDTGIFEQDLFSKSLNEYTDINGGDVGSFLDQIFAVMDTPDKERANLPGFIRAFPYVNGGLFKDRIETPRFTRLSRRLLIEAARLNWREINPDIFGSMIQAVVEPGMRGDLGLHYTSVPNIMKVLQPLFLLDLEKQFADSQDSVGKLNKLHQRLAKIRVFDPACGSGNFLIIAYRELRKLEMRIYKRLRELTGELGWKWSEVTLSNFYGIEYADFAAETAKLSLWIAEYQVNRQFAEVFGDAPPALPLKDGGNIHHRNALTTDWEDICPPAENDVETYIVGNPPYLGRAQQTKEHKKDISFVFSDISKKYKKLDYVACWLIKAAKYTGENKNISFAFVATNSVCQGEQVPLLWPHVLGDTREIYFAHQSFKWKNLASGNAGVTCVVVGVRGKKGGPKTMYVNDVAYRVSNINGYLIDYSDIYIEPISNAKTKKEVMKFGNMPADGGNLLLSTEEKNEILNSFPEADFLFRRIMGSKEFIKKRDRWCLWIDDKNLNAALKIPPIQERIIRTKEMRLNSVDAGTKSLSEAPHQFREMNIASEHSIIVPRVTSESRPYVQVGLLDGKTIISDSAFALYDAPLYLFAIISSKLHVVWIKAVCGQLETRIRYSNTLGYNTFPVPKLYQKDIESLEELAWRVIEAREQHPGKTMADLYDPKKMPLNLLKVHQELDDALETLYIGRPFKNDTERLEHLFKMYAKMTRKKAG
ncbi:hypothetical protein TH19_09945 [Thalassospira profundimaris]|uniref:site-specific DNA-methyltransferase (adenine-specific) n=1 Tax=Thalassospira profundimaris TaxID=502049 RepID=A0A367W7Y4_9PROT|nr:DNA methyltransferase [Thalassospira profundimaris]RCK37564.1 hypothetical protein TH19_09945 [Thalassospira profundimaris]